MRDIDTKCKQILMDFLYPNDEIRKFMINDLNQELEKLLPQKILICNDNKNDELREKNYWKCCKKIGDFLQKHRQYKTAIEKVFSSQDIVSNIRLILLNFVFYKSQMNSKYKDINVFLDKRSITYDGFDFISTIA